MSDHGLDRVLDRAVLPGYSAVGYWLRSRRWAQDDPRPGSLTGRRALVTGAAGGLGEATALGLASLGATVHLVVRSAERAGPAVERISAALERSGSAGSLEVEECDVADLASVQRFADGFVARMNRTGDAVDVLVHNAGVLPETRTESPDGHELTVATHVLGPVLMTELLLPVLARSAVGARVVLVASGGMYAQGLAVDDPEFTHGRYQGAAAYARSKRMQVELTPVLAQRWAGHGVSVHAMHPGWADTPGVASSLPLFRLVTRPVLRSTAAGADTTVWLSATEPPPASGRFWHDRSARPTSYLGSKAPTESDVEVFWTWVRGQTGLGEHVASEPQPQ